MTGLLWYLRNDNDLLRFLLVVGIALGNVALCWRERRSSVVVAVENARLYEVERQRVADLQAILDHLDDGVVVLDSGGRVVRRNAAAVRMLGDLQVGEGVIEWCEKSGSRAYDQSGELLSTLDWPVMRAARGERFSGLEITFRRKDGRTRHLSTDGGPVEGGRGGTLLGVTVIHDITAAREMEQLKDDFLTLAAHELKTPLTSMKGYAQILLASIGNELGSRHRQALESINSQADRINRMVEDFIRGAAVRSRRFSLEPGRIDLAALTAAGCSGFRGLPEEHPIECHLQGPVWVMADTRSVELVLRNLIHNAIKYSQPDGTVNVGLSVQGTHAVVAVRDDGMGIPKDKQEHVFDRFFQVRPGTYSKGGVGLGLYVSNELIVNQGGQMWLESEEGVGSSFYFSLPLADVAIS